MSIYRDSVYLKAGEKKSGLHKDYWEGPYVIEKVISKEYVKSKMNSSRRNPMVHVNWLKPDKADNLEKISSDVKEILDKMRTRNNRVWLETKYFVLLKTRESLWVEDTHLPKDLLVRNNEKL